MSDVDPEPVAENPGETSGDPTDQSQNEEALEAEKAAEEARRKAEEQALEAEKAAEEARRKAEEEETARLKAKEEEEARLKAEEAARLKVSEEARQRAVAEEEKATPKPSPDPDGTTDAAELLAAAEQRLRELLPQVKDTSVLKELSQLADSDALEKLVNRGKPAPKAGFPARGSLKSNPFMAESKTPTNTQANASKFGTVSASSIATGGAGAGGGLGLNKPGFGPKVTHFAGGRGSVSQKAVEISEDVSSAWQEMQDDNSSISWVVTTYSEDGKKLELKEKGEGGLNAFKAGLPENIAWGGFRCYGVDRRGGLTCKRSKFVFVQYKPEASSAIKKAKQAQHKGDVKEVFPGAHLDLVVETMDDLAEQTLIEKLQAATGAHKPNGYEFEEGNFLEADYYGLGIGKSCKGETTVN